MVAAACAIAASCHQRVEAPALPPAVEAYLTEALDAMQRHALTSSRVDWPRVRREARALARSARTTAGAYPAVRHALAALGDHHSFLQLPDALAEAEIRETGARPAAAPARRGPSPFGSRMRPEAEMLDERLAYVFMPQGRRNNAFAAAFQASLAPLAAAGPCGWVVDLRGNGGGDMWPMLAGLGPLLGEGEAGGSIDADGGRDRWIYDAGNAIYQHADGKQEVYAAVADPIAPVSNAPIAVLIDRGTASSGEAMAIAFAGRPRVRHFGEPTYGASTATRGFKLSDGSNLVLAVSVFVDRRGGRYESGMNPDVVLPAPETLPDRADDEVLEAARRWLRDECRR